MKKVIVTGATGFIGKWLVEELCSKSIEVIAVVRKSSMYKLSSLQSNIRIVTCDISNVKALPSLIEDRDIDAFYHLAWQGVSGADLKDEDIQLNNLKTTLNVIDVVKEMSIKTFVGAGSLHEIEGYIEMEADKPILNMGYMYKAAKISAHWMCKAKAGTYGIEFFWPIISNAYGEGEDSGRLINWIIRSIYEGKSPGLSPGLQEYDFIHVKDVAKAFYLIGENGVDGTNYFIGSGASKSLRKYLEIVADIANSTKGGEVISLNFGEKTADVVMLSKKVFDVTNLVEGLGFKPDITFEEGIKRTAEWIKNND